MLWSLCQYKNVYLYCSSKPLYSYYKKSDFEIKIVLDVFMTDFIILRGLTKVGNNFIGYTNSSVSN